MTRRPEALSGGKRDERSGFLIAPRSSLLRKYEDMREVVDVTFPDGMYVGKGSSVDVSARILLGLRRSNRDLSFLVYESDGIKPVGMSLGFHAIRNYMDLREDIAHVDIVAAMPGSMAGSVIMTELLDRINIKRKPVEFHPYPHTTGKILKRRAAVEALKRDGWELEKHGNTTRLEPVEYDFDRVLIRSELGFEPR